MKKSVVIGSIFGLLAVIPTAFGLPYWLLKSEVLIVITCSLVYGFSAFAPRLPSWAYRQEVRGVCLVTLGCVCLFTPTQFILAALLTGIGVRLVISSDFKIGPPDPPSTALRQEPGDIVILQKPNTVETRR